jgi:hypothetical protein
MFSFFNRLHPQAATMVTVLFDFSDAKKFILYNPVNPMILRLFLPMVKV